MSQIELSLIDAERYEVTVVDDVYELELIDGDQVEVFLLAEGLQGEPGTPGAPGPPSVAYVYDQLVPSAFWTITHNLSLFPHVTIVDSLEREVEADVTYLNANVVTVEFANPQTGQAFLS